MVLMSNLDFLDFPSKCTNIPESTSLARSRLDTQSPSMWHVNREHASQGYIRCVVSADLHNTRPLIPTYTYLVHDDQDSPHRQRRQSYSSGITLHLPRPDPIVIIYPGHCSNYDQTLTIEALDMHTYLIAVTSSRGGCATPSQPYLDHRTEKLTYLSRYSSSRPAACYCINQDC